MHSVDIETRHGAGNYLPSLESRIRERAYEIWTARGCVQGQDDQHWLAAEREILTESTATLAVPETGASVARSRSKKSDWQRELRIKFFGMLFGVGIAAAAAFSLGAHHNGSAPVPGPIRETAAPASPPTVGAEVTAARAEGTGVDTDRASTASDVTSDSKSNVATTCDTSGAPVESWWAEETRQMGQVVEEHGPMFRKPRRPRLRPGRQPRDTLNPLRHSAAPQQTDQIQSLGARTGTDHPVITAFGLGLGKLVL